MVRRPHRTLVRLLLGFATLALIGGAGARWVDVQLLSVPDWTATSRRLIENGDVRRAVSGFTVRRTLGQAGIDSAIDHVLPGAVAGPALGALRHAATGAASTLLSSGPGRRAWTRANHQAVAGLLAAVDRPEPSSALVLDLSPLLGDVVGAVAGTSAARAIPGSSQLLTLRSPDAGRLVVLDPSRLRAVRTEVRATRTLAWALPSIALLLLALALLIAVGWRLVALSAIGYRLLVAGGVVLGGRWLLERALAGVAVHSSVDRAGVRAAWLIATSTLRAEAIWLLVAGVVVALGAGALRAVSSPRRR